MASPAKKNSMNFKDPFVLWGAILLGVGIALGGLLGALIGGGAGIYITNLSKKTDWPKSKKILVASGTTLAAVVAYSLVVSAILGM